jgi:hypothetical protein
MEDPLDAIRAKIAARQGRPGYRTNVAEMEREARAVEHRDYIYRDRRTGRFVSPADASKATTLRTRIG